MQPLQARQHLLDDLRAQTNAVVEELVEGILEVSLGQLTSPVLITFGEIFVAHVELLQTAQANAELAARASCTFRHLL